MVAVNVVDGIKYGFRLLGYLLAVFIVGGILLAIGSAFAPSFSNPRGSPIMMGLFYLAGILVIYAGSLGMLYKVIADGVETGTLSAERGGGLGNFGGSGSTSSAGGANRQYANQARQAAQRTQQSVQGTQQGGGQARQGGQHSQQGARGAEGEQGGDHGQAQDQQPPEDWEPGN